MVNNIVSIINNSEPLRYLISGIIVTFISLFIYTILIMVDMNYSCVNIVSIVIAKISAFILNKFYVYLNKSNSVKELIQEIFRFIISRGGTGILDYFAVFFLVEMMHINSLISKYIVILFVICINYILGKKYVFHSKI